MVARFSNSANRMRADGGTNISSTLLQPLCPLLPGLMPFFFHIDGPDLVEQNK